MTKNIIIELITYKLFSLSRVSFETEVSQQGSGQLHEIDTIQTFLQNEYTYLYIASWHRLQLAIWKEGICYKKEASLTFLAYLSIVLLQNN